MCQPTPASTIWMTGHRREHPHHHPPTGVSGRARDVGEGRARAALGGTDGAVADVALEAMVGP